MNVTEPTHVVAIFGGASAGSVAAELLAERGAQVVVFEQNPRPYGKIEDGLPRWHDKQRTMEYGKIDARLDRPGVHYVPLTKLGRDLDFDEVLGWGFSAVLLANGAWKDRELEAEGTEEALGKGLVYQNPFVYWFNHKLEQAYDGERFEVLPGSLCVGGGLASIDVIKIFQLELYQQALAARGIEVDTNTLEHEGIPAVCAAHGIEDPESLGVENCTLLYRRRVEDMPLASLPDSASEKQREKLPMVRRKILEKAQKKFLFQLVPQVVTQAVLMEDGHVTGLRVLRTELAGGRVNPVPGSEFVIPGRLVVSSIGSVPEPIPGIEMKGAYYRYKDWDTGEYAAAPGVFGLGNVVTGQGNIKASLDHGRFVAAHVAEAYLGLTEGERDLSEAGAKAAERGRAAGEAIAEFVGKEAKLEPEVASELLKRVEERQRAVGYDGDYKGWIARVTPADLG
ncbi:MAG: hypothetical protein KDD82_11170 [Planctomycetes bacterium]|nr:hypothetical protein [Planctomycetota bacterium]